MDMNVLQKAQEFAGAKIDGNADQRAGEPKLMAQQPAIPEQATRPNAWRLVAMAHRSGAVLIPQQRAAQEAPCPPGAGPSWGFSVKRHRRSPRPPAQLVGPPLAARQGSWAVAWGRITG